MPTISYSANVDIALAMLNALASNNPEGFLRHTDDAFMYESPFYASAAPVHGRPDMTAMLNKVASIFSSVHFDVVDAFAGSDPQRVVVECRGDSVVASTGASYRNHYVMLLQFRHGKVESWREFSNPDVYRQALAQ
jgi:ketosteroid isomerase-like protein